MKTNEFLTEAGAAPIYYFSYGMLCDPRYMRGAELVGMAELRNFRYEMLQYANVVPEAGSRTYGCLWSLDRGLLSELDQIEGYPTLYDRKTVPVHVDGQKYVAELYTMTPETRSNLRHTRPAQGYINNIVRGYRAAGVPMEQLRLSLKHAHKKQQSVNEAAATWYFFDVTRATGSFTSRDLRAMGLQQNRQGHWYYRPEGDDMTHVHEISQRLNVYPRAWRPAARRELYRETTDASGQWPFANSSDTNEDFNGVVAGVETDSASPISGSTAESVSIFDEDFSELDAHIKSEHGLMDEGDPATATRGDPHPENEFWFPIDDQWPEKLDVAGRPRSEVDEHIGRVKGGYRLYSGRGRNLGTFPSRSGAEKHEREVQYFKHAKEGVAGGSLNEFAPSPGFDDDDGYPRVPEKFNEGDVVWITPNLPEERDHFTKNCPAIVMYSYESKHGGRGERVYPNVDLDDPELSDRDRKYYKDEARARANRPHTYALVVLGKNFVGEKAWYSEKDLTKIFRGTDPAVLCSKGDAYPFADLPANIKQALVKSLGAPGLAEGSEHFDGIEISMEKADDELTVTAMASGKELGHVLFVIDGEYLMPQDLEVDERYQGQGIAATMYNYVKSKGYKIRRSGQQTDAGAGFWDKHKGQGVNVWEQSVAEATGPASLWTVEQRTAGHHKAYYVVRGHGRPRDVWQDARGHGDFRDRAAAEAKAAELNRSGVNEAGKTLPKNYNPNGKTFKGPGNPMPKFDPNDAMMQGDYDHLDTVSATNQGGIDDVETKIDRNRLRALIRASVKSLSPVEKEVLNLRYWHDQTLAQVSNTMGVSSERIRQIEAKSLRKLRDPASSEPLKKYMNPNFEPKPAPVPAAGNVVKSLSTANRPKVSSYYEMGFKDAINGTNSMSDHDAMSSDESWEQRRQYDAGYESGKRKIKSSRFDEEDAWSDGTGAWHSDTSDQWHGQMSESQAMEQYLKEMRDAGYDIL